MRNPERLKQFMKAMLPFEGRVLSDSVCVEIMGELIRVGFYKPIKNKRDDINQLWNDDELLSDEQVSWVVKNNDQDHKEAGFSYGWPSRFRTFSILPSTLGFVYAEPDQIIEIPEITKRLLAETVTPDGISIPVYDEFSIFLNALAHYQRVNPFQRVLNDNKPLTLLLRTLKKLREIEGDDSPGISRRELAFLIIWLDSDHVALVNQILEFRKKHGHNYSDETLFRECDRIVGGFGTKRKQATITHEYPDELLRKVRHTGIFTLRGGGRFISLSPSAIDVSEYVLSNYDVSKSILEPHDYFEMSSTIDDSIVKKFETTPTADEGTITSQLNYWIETIGKPEIESGLLGLAKRKKSTTELLSLIPEPLRLEFLSTLWIKINAPTDFVRGNYKSDDAGFPISHAPGNMPDIERRQSDTNTIYEVTLMTGRDQVHQELVPITRHLKAKLVEGGSARLWFIAPRVHDDATQYVEFITHTSELKIENRTINEFVLAFE